MKQCALSLLPVALIACSGTSREPAQPKVDPATKLSSERPAQHIVVADHELGLSKTSVFDTPVPAQHSYPIKDPGENQRLPRSFVGAPPLVPHEVAGFLPIMADDNSCQECHEEGTYEAPLLPKSHYVDLRNRPAQPGKKIDGARFQCMACHVAQANTPAAVPSDFNPTP